jgi:hypothetical protein
MAYRRIAFSGSAGTGKTTLARSVAKELSLPYIEEGFRKRVDEGMLFYKMNEAERRDLMRDMWREQHSQELDCPNGFVSDRSSVDFAAFWLHYGLTDAEQETSDFIEAMQGEANNIHHVVLCPWGSLPLEADGVRSTNPWLQLRYHALLEGMHQRMTDTVKLLRVPEETTELKRRIEFVLMQLDN